MEASSNDLKQVLPGFEPGSLDSKSRVITITLQKLLGYSKGGHSGARTHDPGLIRPMLYHLSYATVTMNTQSEARTRDLLRVKQAS